MSGSVTLERQRPAGPVVALVLDADEGAAAGRKVRLAGNDHSDRPAIAAGRCHRQVDLGGNGHLIAGSEARGGLPNDRLRYGGGAVPILLTSNRTTPTKTI